MSARRYYGTPAHLASQPGAPQQPPRRYSQAELRDRRRGGLSTAHYGGDWSLSAEIAAICEPLAQRIAAAHKPSRFGHSMHSVPWLLEDIHELVGVVVGWVTENDAMRKTAHLKDEPGKRRNAVQALCDLAPRPELPTVTDDDLETGAWAGKAVAMAESVDAAFSALLGRAYPPGANGLRGQPSRSERLESLLGRTLDRAALALEQRLNRDEDASHRESTQTKTERARAELEKLGVTP